MAVKLHYIWRRAKISALEQNTNDCLFSLVWNRLNCNFPYKVM